jgi:hypothetical protein
MREEERRITHESKEWRKIRIGWAFAIGLLIAAAIEHFWR